jgi:hypothetical protein
MTPIKRPTDGETGDRAGPPLGHKADRSERAADRLQRPRGRHGHEVTASRDAAIVRLRGRAERAEAELAGQRREAARAIGALQAEVTFWRLRAQGASVAEAAAGAGLLEAPAE